MALVEATLSCTATNSTTVTNQPTKVLSSSATSVPTLLKLPSRTLSVIATTIPRLIKLPGHVFLTTRTTNIFISAIRLGADSMDVLDVKRKWFVSEVGRWSVSVEQRFKMIVRGRPSG